MKGLVRKIALTGALILGALSCSPKQPDRVGIFVDRIKQYESLCEQEEMGILKVDHEEYKDVKEYIETGKVPDYVINPEKEAEKPVEQQTKIKVVKVKPVESRGELFNQDAEESRWTVSPYAFQKSKFNDKDDIGPYTGAGVRVKRDLNSRVGLYGKLEFDSASDTQSTDISRAELKSTGTTAAIGLEFTPIKTNNFELETYLGAQLRHEQNEGYIQVLDARRDISESETMGGWETGVRAKVTTANKRFGAYVGAGLEEAGDSGLGYRLETGVGVKF